MVKFQSYVLYLARVWYCKGCMPDIGLGLTFITCLVRWWLGKIYFSCSWFQKDSFIFVLISLGYVSCRQEISCFFVTCWLDCFLYLYSSFHIIQTSVASISSIIPLHFIFLTYLLSWNWRHSSQRKLFVAAELTLLYRSVFLIAIITFCHSETHAVVCFLALSSVCISLLIRLSSTHLAPAFLYMRRLITYMFCLFSSSKIVLSVILWDSIIDRCQLLGFEDSFCYICSCLRRLILFSKYCVSHVVDPCTTEQWWC